MSADDAQRWSEFERLVREIGTGLLTSHGPDGSLHTRPLQTLRVSRGALWFFTDRDSPKTAEVRGHFHVSVGYADVGRHRFAAVSGVGRLHLDHELAQELWQVDQRAYYPEGPRDNRLAVLEVGIERAEYWLAPGRPAYHLAALRAAVSGQPAARIAENHQLQRHRGPSLASDPTPM